jgi:hypothetical protein
MTRVLNPLLLALICACASFPVGSMDSRDAGIGAGLLRTGGLLLRTAVQASGRVGQAVWADVRTLRVQVRDARKLHESTLRRTDLEAGGGSVGFDSIFPGNVIVQVSLGGSAGEELGSASSTVEVQLGLVTQAELSVRLKPTVLVAGSLEAHLKVLESEEILVSGVSSPAHGASGSPSASLGQVPARGVTSAVLSLG